MKKYLLAMALSTVALMAASTTAYAHEGEDHSGPAALKPQRKGIVKGNEKYFIEVVHSAKKIDLYAYSTKTDLKNPKTLDPLTVKLLVSAELPRQKPVSLKLIPDGDHLTAPFDSKNTHRTTILVKIEGNDEDLLKYTFEKHK